MKKILTALGVAALTLSGSSYISGYPFSGNTRSNDGTAIGGGIGGDITGDDTGTDGDANDNEITWLTINLDTPGSLGVEVLYKVNTLDDVTSLKITGPMNSQDWATIRNMSRIENLDIHGTNTTEIPSEIFYRRKSLKSVLLPETLESIGSSAFRETSLESIVIPENVKSVGSRAFNDIATLVSAVWNTLAGVPDYCFSGCDVLEKVKIAEGCTYFGSHSFYSCDALSEINFPGTIGSIGDNAFAYDKALTDVVFPDGLGSIWSNAFYNTGLKKAILPAKLNVLESWAFAHCDSLREVVLSGVIREYNGSQFNSCAKLQKVTCPTATPPSTDNMFNNIDRWNVTLVVPDFATSSYLLDSYWKSFGKIEGGATSDIWTVNQPLLLSGSNRMQGTPSVDITPGGSLTVKGETPQTFNTLTIAQNFNKYNHKDWQFAQLINQGSTMTANDVTLSFDTYARKWYFLSVPCDVRMSDISHSTGSDFVIRLYDGSARAQNGMGASWIDVPADGVLEAGQAYIYQGYSEGTVVMHLQKEAIAHLLSSGDRATEVAANVSENAANAGWNLIGNPYTSYYDMAATSLTCPVTLWNFANQRYEAYSLIDDDVVLRPMDAFFMQQQDIDGSVTFGREGRQITSEVSRQNRVPASGVSERVLLNLYLEDASGEADRTRVVVNPKASFGYEAACDASKFFSPNGDKAEFYTIDSDGNKLSINERPLGDGMVKLGFYAPEVGELTISLGDFRGVAILRDAVTGTETDLAKSAYTFRVNDKCSDNGRFSMRIKPEGTAGAEMLAADASVAMSVETGIGSVMVKGAAGRRVDIYTLDGSLVLSVASASEAQAISLNSGAYVAKSADEAVKFIVK